MAITAANLNVGNNGEGVVTVVADSGGGTSAGFDMSRWPVRGVQRVTGTGTYTVEGSMDGTNFGALPTAISGANDAAIRAVLGNPRFVRVTIASDAATVVLVGSRA